MKTPPSHYSLNNKNNMLVSTGVFGGSALSRVFTNLKVSEIPTNVGVLPKWAFGIMCAHCR